MAEHYLRIYRLVCGQCGENVDSVFQYRPSSPFPTKVGDRKCPVCDGSLLWQEVEKGETE